jgi:hypothetical protein
MILVPLSLLYPIKIQVFYFRSTLPPSNNTGYLGNSKERKQQKEEIEEIIEKIAKADPKVKKVDFSNLKIPYSILKKLFAAVSRNSPALYSLNLANIGFTAAHVQLFELAIQKNMNLRFAFVCYTIFILTPS